ncbi:MAG: PAS domain S-box protein [Nitrospirota bacterium]
MAGHERVRFGKLAESGHFVQFYEDRAFLVGAVSQFIGAGLEAGQAGIVIATPACRESLAERLEARGLDLAAAIERGQYVALDAAETLATLMADGGPDETRFVEVVGSVVARAECRHPRVRAFGEMVALLWAEGKPEAALRLEEFWNRLGKRHSFSLFCAYPMSAFGREADSGPFREVCQAHAHVVPAESYTRLASPDERLKAVSQLQQQATALGSERKRAGDALQENERRYGLLVENAPVCIHEIDLDGRLVSMNQAGLKMMGVKDEAEIRGHAYLDVVAPEDRERIGRLLSRAFAGQASEFEFSATTAQGILHFSSCFVPIKGADGSVLRLMGITQDVTERKRAEESLVQGAAKYRQIVDTAYDAFVSMDADGGIRDWNRQAEATFGWTREEAIGQTLSELIIPPRFRDAHQQGLRRFLATGEGTVLNKRIEVTALHRDGREFPAELTVNPLRLGERLVFNAFVHDITERKRAEEELRGSEERFRSAFEETAVGMVLFDPKGRFLRTNRAFSNMVGYAEDELLAMTFRDITHPDDLDWNNRAVERLLAGQEKSLQIEKRYRHKLGHTVWASVSVSAVRDTAGQALTMIAQSQDITGRKRAEAELHFARQVIDQTQDPIYWLSPEEGFRFVYANEAACRHYGYPAEALLRMSVPDWDPNFTLEECEKVWRALKVEKSRTFETLHRRSTGEVVPVEVTANYVTFGGKEYVAGLIRDITKRKRAEAQLAESERKYRELVNSLQAVVWEADPADFRITYVSPQVQPMLGYRPEQWLHELAWKDFIHPDDLERVLETCRTETAAGRNHSLEYRMLAADGHVKWVRDETTVVVEHGRPVKLRGVLLDVTERKQLEEQLRQSEKLASLGTLLGGVAHELNNPLFIISGFVEMALDRAKRTEDTALIDAMLKVQEAARRSAAIVDRFLGVARTGVKQRGLCDCNAVVKQALTIVANDLELHRIEVQPDFYPTLPSVLADSNELIQVLLNLCINARQAMVEAHGRGTLRLVTRLVHELRTPWVEIRVTDDGPGMDRETLLRIFDPFFTTKPVGQGTGLGLTMAHRIVSELGGTLTCASEVGKGATFILRLPPAQGKLGSQTSGTAEPAGMDSPLADDHTVLLVDDEPAIVQMLGTYLERLGYRVSRATSGLEALETLSRGRHDALIMDFSMPKMDGASLYMRAVSLQPDLARRTILLTGASQAAAVEKFLRETECRVVSKPVSLQQLAQELKTVFVNDMV